jgi:8-oxo-dGTP pyrophosphatase MutT (NUDIX family)
MNSSPVVVAAVILVNRDGHLLLQLRDESARFWPGVWGLPGGHQESGESDHETATRELLEETSLCADLTHLESQIVNDRLKHYFYGPTDAEQADVVIGEGAAIVFTPPDQVLDGRAYTPGTAEVLARFLESPEYERLANRRGVA